MRWLSHRLAAACLPVQRNANNAYRSEENIGSVLASRLGGHARCDLSPSARPRLERYAASDSLLQRSELRACLDTTCYVRCGDPAYDVSVFAVESSLLSMEMENAMAE